MNCIIEWDPLSGARQTQRAVKREAGRIKHFKKGKDMFSSRFGVPGSDRLP